MNTYGTYSSCTMLLNIELLNCRRWDVACVAWLVRHPMLIRLSCLSVNVLRGSVIYFRGRGSASDAKRATTASFWRAVSVSMTTGCYGNGRSSTSPTVFAKSWGSHWRSAEHIGWTIRLRTCSRTPITLIFRWVIRSNAHLFTHSIIHSPTG